MVTRHKKIFEADCRQALARLPLRLGFRAPETAGFASRKNILLVVIFSRYTAASSVISRRIAGSIKRSSD
jgi:hypothetical protein